MTTPTTTAPIQTTQQGPAIEVTGPLREAIRRESEGL